jgi:phosphonopyruvate decarboxylase
MTSPWQAPSEQNVKMIQAEDFISECASRDHMFFAGVPCSFLTPLINCAINRSDLNYIAATSEGEAVAIAAGAYLGGRKTVVMCQNSGLGNAVNPLTSLNYPFRIPTLLIVTLRGEPGINDEPQHELMGQISAPLLDVLRIPSAFLPDDHETFTDAFNRAEEKMQVDGLPYAFIMQKGSVAANDIDVEREGAPPATPAVPAGSFACDPKQRMARIDAIKIIRELLPDSAAIVATTGKIGRELFASGDRENHLYMVGSMGCAAGVGFGIQHVQPDRRVVVLDGDGAALMKMGTLATIGHYKPQKLLNIIIDNETYESTGGQSSVSSTVDFCGTAASCGYSLCIRADTKQDLREAVQQTIESPGPSLIHVKVACGSAPSLGRPTVKPVEVRKRFMRFLQSRRN